jgi:hypothetical protein
MSDSEGIVIAGALADAPVARELAEQVQRVHYRYASEVVAQFRLCPFLNDPETAFGRFCVMLEREPDLERAAEQVEKAGAKVVHLVYPLVTMASTPFERFGNQLHKLVASRLAGAPVHASFHPEMEGGRGAAARLVGLLRRAPDPFVQFVPEGLHEGGTVYTDLSSVDLASLVVKVPKDRAESLHERLDEASLDRIEALQRDIKRDRDESYARFVDAMG